MPRTRLRRLLSLAALTTLAATLIPAMAEAAVSCKYEAGAEVLQVVMSASGDNSALSLGPAGKIVVRSGAENVACSGGSPTLANTGDITVSDTSSSGERNTKLTVSGPAAFAPTTKIIDAPSNGGEDILALVGTEAMDRLGIGTGGVDSNFDEVVDIVFFGAVPDIFQINTADGDDSVYAHGGFGTGSALPGSTYVEVEGGAGDDSLIGGEGRDSLDGGDGGDYLAGEGGDDALIPDHGGAAGGDDTMYGVQGNDAVLYEYASNRVEVDLATGMATGEGSDKLQGITIVIGSPFDDRLIGSDGSDFLEGVGGDDLLEGGPADDVLDGGVGEDTVSYAEAPAGVEVNLTTYAAGGEGKDILGAVENIVGTGFDDLIVGDIGPNRLSGGAGADTIRAGGGDDQVEARDGFGDDVGCGDGDDRAVADQLSVDRVGSDCEVVDALPEPAAALGPVGSPGPGPGPATATATATCTVPKLLGFGLVTARKKLLRAGCRLGKVRGRHRRGWKVAKQEKRPGTVLPAGSKVAVRLRAPAPQPSHGGAR